MIKNKLPNEQYTIIGDFINICWKYTNKCNMNCSYCNINNKTKIKTNFNDIIKSTIEREANKYPNISFYIDIEGGEPTLDKKVFELVSKGNIYYKLFTNFKNPDFNKLNNFLLINRVEISVNCDFDVETTIKNLMKLNINDNLTVSVIVTKYSKKHNVDKIMKFLKEKNINHFLSEAEDFTKLQIEPTPFSHYKKLSRLKFNFFNYICNTNHIDVSCDSLYMTNCSNNFKAIFLKFDALDYINSVFKCKSKVCGIHDYQLSYKKYKRYIDDKKI